MKRRQFLAIACVATAFADACKSKDPTPATTVQGTIMDATGKPVVGLELEFWGDGGGGNPSSFGFGSSKPYVSFSEKTVTDPNGFFKIIKVVPDGIDLDGTQLILPYNSNNYVETKKNGVLISRNLVLAQTFDIELGKVNEYLITFYR